MGATPSELKRGPEPDHPQDELSELRALLLGQQMVELQELHKRLDDPNLRAEELSQVLAKAVALSTRRDRELQRSFYPIVEQALQISVTRNPKFLATSLAPIIGETVRNVPFIPPPDYWRKIRAACDKHGALLILDEIPTGLGRTGRMFACEHFGVVPDMLVLGKALGGGVMPLAALLAREHLNIAAEKAIGHYTHEKNPVAAAAGLATLEFIESENLLEHVRVISALALETLSAMKSRHPLIGDVRGLGLILGVELVKDRATMERDSEAADQVMYEALRRGLNFKIAMGNVLLLTPALTISAAEMERALGILETAVAAVARRRSPAVVP